MPRLSAPSLLVMLAVLTASPTHIGALSQRQSLSIQQAPSHWCPMHPDERASSAVPCAICRMTMVPIPQMRVGEYRMDVTPIAAAAGAGLAGVRVVVRDPSGGAAVQAFETVHEKTFHLFVVGRDLEFFRHLHPEALKDGVLEARAELPPGEYMVIADFLPTGGQPQLLQRAIVSPGPRTLRPAVPESRRPAFVIVGGVRAQPFSLGLPVGEESEFLVVLTRAEDGRPVIGMEPFLGAGAHLLAVSEDLTNVVHAHAPLTDMDQSLLQFELTLPTAGAYAVWVQFQWRGAQITSRLSVTAR